MFAPIDRRHKYVLVSTLVRVLRITDPPGGSAPPERGCARASRA